MKFSAQEEYGLRCLLQIGRIGQEKSITIPEISKAEGITKDNVAKLLRLLRQGGYIESARGHKGGYTLARPAEDIPLAEVLALLGGRLYDAEFCSKYSGNAQPPLCTHSINCSIRSIWKTIQSLVDHFLSQITLKDLLEDEEEQTQRLMLLKNSINFSAFSLPTTSSPACSSGSVQIKSTSSS
jgi:Rrf2 family protein